MKSKLSQEREDGCRHKRGLAHPPQNLSFSLNFQPHCVQKLALGFAEADAANILGGTTLGLVATVTFVAIKLCFAVRGGYWEGSPRMEDS